MANMCLLSDRCGTPGVGCTIDVATVSNCGFIAELEKKKKRIQEKFLDMLRRDGVFFYESAEYLELKKKKGILTSEEFRRAEDAAVIEYYAAKEEIGECQELLLVQE